MKIRALLFALTAIIPLASYAQPIDIIGGPDGSSQTMHHCGFLASSGSLYTSSPVLVGIIERKLQQLGYLKTGSDRVYGKADRAAVKKFQADYGLSSDGIVGPLTAQKLAFFGHPSSHVRSCYRVAKR